MLYKKITPFLILLINLSFNAQTHYEKAYFIENDNVRTDCLIKNIDWKDNPTEIDYKILTTDNKIIREIQHIKEFGSDNLYKYERKEILLDTSATDIDKLGINSKPEFKNKIVFLKKLVEGEASLYEYSSNGNVYFFYSVNKSTIEQLIYKKYLVNITNIRVNNGFQNQLLSYVKSDAISFIDISKLNYNRKELSNYFIKYNNNLGNKFIDYNKSVSKGSFNFKLKAGINFSSLDLNVLFNNDYSYTTRTEKQTNLNYGIEFEYLLPFRNNKWSIYIEPTYSNYKSQGQTTFNPTELDYYSLTRNWEVDYNYLNISLGMRYFIFLTDNSKLFLDCAFVMNQPLDSKVYNVEETLQLNTGTKNSAAFGVGYSYKSKYMIAIKINSYNILDNYTSYSSKFTTTSINFGYKIFNINKNKKND